MSRNWNLENEEDEIIILFIFMIKYSNIWKCPISIDVIIVIKYTDDSESRYQFINNLI